MELLVYKRFFDEADAIALGDIFIANDIEFTITENSGNLDSLYGDKEYSKQHFINIQSKDFAAADALLLAQGEDELDQVDKEHYLYKFTDEELFEILEKPDEWSGLDYQLAKKLLKEKGKDISAEALTLMKQRRVEQLAAPDDGGRFWIVAGYIFAFLGGPGGIFLGLVLRTSTKTLPDGTRVHTYSKEDRRHGSIMWMVGTGVLIVSVIVWLIINVDRF